MSPENVIDNTVAYLKQQFSGESSGHDWWHIYRVWQNALYLARQENANLYIVQLGALLHDIADWKFNNGDEKAGAIAARSWLQSQMVPEEIIVEVCKIINEVTFKGAGVDTPVSTLESRIVQDADRLDAIGAIGIARAFAYGGFKNREMHNPDVQPEEHSSFEAYKKNQGPTINHFYEKLLRLKDRMQTETGKKLAAERHTYMIAFLDQFYQEWNIKADR